MQHRRCMQFLFLHSQPNDLSGTGVMGTSCPPAVIICWAYQVWTSAGTLGTGVNWGAMLGPMG